MNKLTVPLKKIKYDELIWEDATNSSSQKEFEIQNEQGDFENLLSQEADQAFRLKEGEIVKGVITGLSRDHVTVDIGHKSTGNISLSEFKNLKREDLVLGQEVDVLLESFEDEEGSLLLSKSKADQIRSWSRISQAYENGDFVKGLILGRIKGGLAVDIGVRAFLPGSQIDLRPTRNLDKWVGKELDFKIIKFNRRRNNIVLSRRVLLEEARAQQRDLTLKNLEVGQVVQGVVKNVTDYGAFVDLGGLDGLLHVTDMSWARRVNPLEILKIGESIDVKVLSFDQEKMKVSLGLRQMSPDPWDGIDERYQIDQKLTGKVVSLIDYGAFIEVGPGVEGLIHITEMSWSRRIKHPSHLLNVDDEVEVIVLEIDKENRRISLGLKQTNPNPWDGITEKYHVGDVIRAQISNVTDFGIFVAIEEGVDGLIHVSDISWTDRVERPQDIYKKNDEIDAKVLKIDVNNRRFSLGIKQLEEDPYYQAARHLEPGSVLQTKVTKVVDFGCFVEVEKNVEGLIHNSELLNPEDKPKEGDSVECVVLAIQPEDHRFELSEKAVHGLSDHHKRTIESAQMESRTQMSEAFSQAQKRKSQQ